MIYLILFFILFILFYILACYIPKLWCRIGLHKWDSPGGHCVDCGICDEFLGPHSECSKK